MNALNSLMGGPDDPVECRTLGEMSVHWFRSDAKPGEPCLCGKVMKRYVREDEW